MPQAPDTDVTPVPASSVTTWDHEADVVIAGYGVADAAAAVEAAQQSPPTTRARRAEKIRCCTRRPNG